MVPVPSKDISMGYENFIKIRILVHGNIKI